MEEMESVSPKDNIKEHFEDFVTDYMCWRRDE